MMTKTKQIVAFGEVMLRLTPPDNTSILQTNRFSAVYGGSESNVLVALSSMGHKTRLISAVPDNALGASVIKHLRSYGVDTSLMKQEGDTLGMYFLEEGFGDRQSQVIYARKHAEITHLSENDFSYDDVFCDCGLFHISGISFALSASVKALCFRLLKEAKNRNIPISFDFNYRSKLWREQEAKEVFQQVMPYVDIVFCSERDLHTFLDCSVSTYFALYPDTQYLVVREREAVSLQEHRMQADIYQKTKKRASVKRESFPVLERIGGGDAFAAGVLHGLLCHPEDVQGALDFGAASFVLKHTVKGDVLPLDETEIDTYITHGAKDVKR